MSGVAWAGLGHSVLGTQVSLCAVNQAPPMGPTATAFVAPSVLGEDC